MADSQSEETRESRISKALLGRVAAVGLFIALGTSAVLFMMDDSKLIQGLGSGSDTETPPANSTGQTASPTESSADPAANLIAQVKANFAENQPAESRPVAGAPNSTPIKNPLPAKPDAPAESGFKPQASFSDQTAAPKSGGPPERFAALGQFGVPAPGSGGVNGGTGGPTSRPDPASSPAASNSATFNPAGSNPVASKSASSAPAQPQDNAPFNPTPFKPLAAGDPSKPISNPNPSGSFQNSPAAGANGAGGGAAALAGAAADTLGRSAERTSPEPLKPFVAPELTNRLASPSDVNAPNLKAPVPNKDAQNGSQPESPKVADNRAFDNIGKPDGNGIMRAAESVNGSAVPSDQNPGQTPRLNASPMPGNANPSFGAAPLGNPAARDQGTPPTGFGNNPPNPGSAAPFSQTNPSLAAGNRTNALPASAPISAGSAINQPLNAPPRQPLGNSGMELNAAEPKTANVPGERRLEGMQAPALTVEKISPREITLNEVADFVIVIRNVGRVVANDVTVHDQVPANTEFQGSNPPPTGGQSERKLLWQLGAIAAGQEKRIQYQLKPTTPGEIGSVAHVTFATQASMRTVVTHPVLEILHRAKPVAMVGSDIIFDVIVTNKGNGPAKDVLIQEDVPTQLQYQEGYRELEYEVGTLMPGQSKRIQLPLKAVSVGKLRNTISAIATGGQRVQHEIDLEIVAPKLTVQSDGPTKRFLGRQVQHQFKIANQGTANATNVDLVAKLPSGLRFLQANNQGVYRRENHAVYWSMAELAANGEASVELLTMPVEAGTQDIKFEVVSDLNQTAAVSHSLNIEHLVDILFDIDDLIDPIEVGADTAYQIKIANQGTQPAHNVQLQIEFPNGILPTTVEGSLQNQVAGQRVQFAPINNLKPGEQLTVVVRAKGQAAGDHRVVVTMQADGRQSAISKEEMTRVYSDR